MIHALPGLLAQTLAQDVTDLGLATGVLVAPCLAKTGAAEFDGPEAAQAAVFVQLGALAQETPFGTRAPGSEIRLPFVAEVTLALAGPEALAPGAAVTQPPGVALEGADLLLSVVMDRLERPTDADAAPPLCRAQAQIGPRRISAEWRFAGVSALRPSLVAQRKLWQIEARFEGVQRLSPVPAEAAPILRALISAQSPAGAREARLEATSGQLPLSLFLGIGPDEATRVASFGLVRLDDLMQLPRANLSARCAEIAGENAALAEALEVLHAVAMLRRDALLGGVQVVPLDPHHAALTLDQIWDGTTLTLPAEMRVNQRTTVRLMAQLLIRLIRPEERARISLGQLATLEPEAR